MKRWIFAALMALLLPALFSGSEAQTEVPQAIRLQGYLTDDRGAPINGQVSMTFDLYDAPSGGNFIDRFGPELVSVSNGIYHVDLGFSADDFAGEHRYIEHIVDGEVLSPRTRVVSTPYSYRTGLGGSGGVSCWDLNGNAQCDPATEDVNADSACDALDCQGPSGPQGPEGPPGDPGPQGIPGEMGPAGLNQSLREWPQQASYGSIGRESDIKHHRAIISLFMDDPTSSAADIFIPLLEGTDGNRTALNDADGPRSASQALKVTHPCAGFLCNGERGTHLFRIGQRIRIGDNAETRVIAITTDDTVIIEDEQDWDDGDEIMLVIKGSLGVVASAIDKTHTGRIGSSGYSFCDDTRRNSNGTTATNAAGGSMVTLSAPFFSASEQTNFDGGMIRFCTDAGCLADEAARYEISDVISPTELTVVGTIPEAHGGVGFYVASTPDDDCMTSAELASIAAAGHSITYHGYDHTAFSNMTEAEIVADIETGLPMLESVAGVPVDGFLFPFNSASPGSANVAARFFDYIMGAGPGHSTGGMTTNIPPVLSTNLSRGQNLDSSLALTHLQDAVDNTEAQGGWSILYGHGMTSGMAAVVGAWIDDTIENHPDVVFLPTDEAWQIRGNRFDTYGLTLGADGSIGRTDWIQGTAQAGTANTIQLSWDASPLDDAYNGGKIQIIAGTGTGQPLKYIADYDGATRVATIEGTFDPVLDHTSVYRILMRRITVAGELGPTTIRGPLTIKDDNSSPSNVLFEISAISETAGNDCDLTYVQGGDPGWHNSLVLNNDCNGGDGRPLFIGSEGDGVARTYVEIGSAEATADEERSILLAIVEGKEDKKLYVTRDGELIQAGLPTGAFPACSSQWDGALLWDTTTLEFKACNGSAWESLFVGKRIRSGDAPETCTVNEIFLDTGGATKELCVCTATDTWSCSSFDTLDGPAD